MPERLRHWTSPVAASLALLAISAAGSARAQSDPGNHDSAGDQSDEAEAVALHRRSAELYREGRYADAAVLLREAYRKTPDPVIQYNLGRACERMADYACASAAYETYLATGNPPDRAAVETLLTNSRAQLAAQRRRAELMPESAAEDRRDDPRAGRGPPGWRRVAPPVTTGIGVAGIGVGLVLAAVARSRHGDALAEPSQIGAHDRQRSAQAMMDVANVALIAGAVIAAGGGAWWFLEARAGRARSAGRAAALHIGPRSVGFSVAF